MKTELANHEKNRRKIIITTFSAVLLHIVSMYLVGYLQNQALLLCSTNLYMVIKLLLRWTYLIVPIIFMKLGGEKLQDIGLNCKDKLPSQIILGIVLGSADAITIVGLTVLLGFKEQLGTPLYQEMWQYVFNFFYMIFAVGLSEEIFFRGFLFKRLLDIKNSKCFAIILSSLIFGMCHLVANGGFIQSLPQAAFAFASGIFYCILRDKIKNCTLVTLIFMHGVYDALIVFLIYFISLS